MARHRRMSRGDAMAANAGYSDYNSKSMMGATGDSKYAIPGLDINPIGEQAATAHTAHAKMRVGALDQMSNGSMNYLRHQDKIFDHNVGRIRKHAIDKMYTEES